MTDTTQAVVDQTTQPDAIMMTSTGTAAHPVTVVECLICDRKVRISARNRYTLRIVLRRFGGHPCHGMRGL